MKETEVEDIKELLNDSGISECYCKKLSGKTKEGREFKSAAFIITCDIKYKDIMFDASTWPVNCSFREWVFSDKTSG